MQLWNDARRSDGEAPTEKQLYLAPKWLFNPLKTMSWNFSAFNASATVLRISLDGSGPNTREINLTSKQISKSLLLKGRSHVEFQVWPYQSRMKRRKFGRSEKFTYCSEKSKNTLLEIMPGTEPLFRLWYFNCLLKRLTKSLNFKNIIDILLLHNLQNTNCCSFNAFS